MQDMFAPLSYYTGQLRPYYSSLKPVHGDGIYGWSPKEIYNHVYLGHGKNIAGLVEIAGRYPHLNLLVIDSGIELSAASSQYKDDPRLPDAARELLSDARKHERRDIPDNLDVMDNRFEEVLPFLQDYSLREIQARFVFHNMNFGYTHHMLSTLRQKMDPYQTVSAYRPNSSIAFSYPFAFEEALLWVIDDVGFKLRDAPRELSWNYTYAERFFRDTSETLKFIAKNGAYPTWVNLYEAELMAYIKSNEENSSGWQMFVPREMTVELA
jgi:hypothetical protein